MATKNEDLRYCIRVGSTGALVGLTIVDLEGISWLMNNALANPTENLGEFSRSLAHRADGTYLELMVDSLATDMAQFVREKATREARAAKAKATRAAKKAAAA